MSLSKTITTFLITAILGAFAFIFTSPKSTKSSGKTVKISPDKNREEQEDLFI
ncbi:MAG: hypothetical protein KI790_07715 [Cyclobacteriaceae bacterium]|nr:hypothetical protein [Cyclobacteriaceae bacterium HetDA_MAG_MS6]